MSRRRVMLVASLLAVSAWLLYSRTAAYDFIHYDDVRILLQHPDRYAQPTLRGTLRAIVLDDFPREEPLILRDLSWAWDSAWFGFGEAWIYHTGNVLLHGFVVALLYLVLMRTTGRAAFSLLTAGFYLVLAVHVEPVAWIMGRKDILSALFMLVAFYAQTRRLQTCSITRQAGWYSMTLLSLAAGLFSKISVLSFPAALFLHAVFYPHLSGLKPPAAPLAWRPILRKELPLAVPPIVLSLLVFVWYRGMLSAIGILDRGYDATGLAHGLNLLRINPIVWIVYGRQIFFPFHLSVLYPWSLLSAVSLAPSVLICLLLAAVSVWFYLTRKDLLFYVMTFLVLMVPYMNIQYIGIWIADRYVYFSAWCLVAIVVDTLLRCIRKGKWVRISATACVLFSVGWNLAHNVLYQPAWRNAETLWQYHIALPTASIVAFENLAAFYYHQFTEASDQRERVQFLQKMETVVDATVAQFMPDQARPVHPGLWYTLFLQAIVHEVRGRDQEALRDWELSARLMPGFHATHLNLAMLYYRLSSQSVGREQAYAEAAGYHYDLYMKYAYRGRQPPTTVLTMRERMRDHTVLLRQEARQGIDAAPEGDRRNDDEVETLQF